MTEASIHDHPDDHIPWSTFPGLNPCFVNLDRDSFKDTAWSWCLHVRVPGTTLDDVKAFYTLVLAETAEAHTWLADDANRDIVAACGGDSFQAWAETYPQDEEDSRALHLYFGAPDLDAARMSAVAFLALTGLTASDVALSTSGDWAEQAPIPQRST